MMHCIVMASGETHCNRKLPVNVCSLAVLNLSIITVLTDVSMWILIKSP